MESGSQPDIPHKQSSQRFAHIIGTLIALLTLAVPLLTIAYFSSTPTESWQSPVYRVLPRD
ncbi:MAG: hypothetical protein IGR76_11520 [Synechococcales cyanobacterium T60_A2020_003]|nr:hypothetical protein [Synechococcales cyanobacterium T60_A2020_003]